MSAKGVLTGLVIGVLLAGGGVYMVTSGGAVSAAEKLRDLAAKLQEVTASKLEVERKVADLQKVVEERDKRLLGYTQYSHYLTAGKKQLQAQAKLLTASVRRHEGYTSYFTTSMLGGLVKSSGAVKVNYTADYNFGFDFDKDAYEILETPAGIQIRIGRPKLIGKPSVSGLGHQVLTDGLFTDPQAAVIKLQQQAADRVLQQGLDMAKQPAIAALCEKTLIKTLGDFLAQQPGVKFIPQITVAYR